MKHDSASASALARRLFRRLRAGALAIVVASPTLAGTLAFAGSVPACLGSIGGPADDDATNQASSRSDDDGSSAAGTTLGGSSGVVPLGKAGAGGNVCSAPVALAPLDGAARVGDGNPDTCTEATLRTAFVAGGTIAFDCGAAPITITVTSPLISPEDVVLDGENNITISGGGTTRIFEGTTGKKMTLQRLTVRDGFANDTKGAGALHTNWRSMLTVIDCRFLDNVGIGGNTERAGGAISTHDSKTVILNSTFEGNRGRLGSALNILLSDAEIINSTIQKNTLEEEGFGGAIFIDGAGIEDKVPGDPNAGFRGVGSIRVCGSLIAENDGAQAHGAGGIYYCGYDDNSALIDRTTIVDNVTKDRGGAVNANCNGRVRIDASTLARNRATYGGAVSVDCTDDACKGDNPEARTLITRSTLVENDASVEGGIGGAIMAWSALDLVGVTVARNRGYYGGALSGAAKVRATDTIFADNQIANPYNSYKSCGGSLRSAAGVLEWPAVVADDYNAPCSPGGPTGDPKIGPLADNGGPTQTCALGDGSAALGLGTTCNEPDQRGTPRSTPCDLGAWASP